MEIDKKPNCLEHCNAICCREGIYLGLNPEEYEYFSEAGMTLELIGHMDATSGRLTYKRLKDCPFLNGRICIRDPRVTGKSDDRPVICSSFISGSLGCLKLRANHPNNVKMLTQADIHFQQNFFGYDDSDS